MEDALLFTRERSHCSLCLCGHGVDVGGAVLLLPGLTLLAGHPVHLRAVVVVVVSLSLPKLGVKRPGMLEDGGGGHDGVRDELLAPGGVRFRFLAPLCPLLVISPGLMELPVPELPKVVWYNSSFGNGGWHPD